MSLSGCADAGGFSGTGEKVPTHKVDHKEHGDLNRWTQSRGEHSPSPEDKELSTADLPKLPRCEEMSLPPKQVSCLHSCTGKNGNAYKPRK